MNAAHLHWRNYFHEPTKIAVQLHIELSKEEMFDDLF